MRRIKVFLCASHKDVNKAELIRDTLSECYGFDVFFYDHNLIGSQDFHKEIIENLHSCEIFIPLISKNMIKSTFCNQEIGFAVNKLTRNENIIYPVSLDGTKTYDFLDHLQSSKCDQNDQYGVLKITTGFFNILVSHNSFRQFQQRAIDCMLDILVSTSYWKAISTISYTLHITKDKIELSGYQTNKIEQAIKYNNSIQKESKERARLCNLLQVKYKIHID